MSLENEYGGITPPSEDNYTENFPLQKVIFDIDIADTFHDEMTWPPTAVHARLLRMNLMEALYHGDFSYVWNEFLSVPVNYFKMVTSMIVNEIMTVPLEIPGSTPQFKMDLYKSLYRLLEDLIKYGTGVLRMYEEGPGVIDPRYYYPTDSGYIISTPFVSSKAESEKVDRILIERYNAEVDPNSLFIEEFNFEGGYQIYEPIPGSYRVEATSPNGLIQIGRQPTENDSDYGYRLYEDILPMALALAIQRSDGQYFGRYHARPAPAVRINESDADDAYDIMQTDTSAERNEKISKGVSSIFPKHPGGARIPEHVQAMEMVVWDGKREDVREETKILEKLIFNTAGVSVDIQGEQSQGRSGTATKHQRLLQYSTSEALKYAVKYAVDFVTGKESEWPSVMDQEQMQGQQQQNTNAESGNVTN